MSMVEELKTVIADANHVADTRADCDVARFLRDHGQALVELVKDSERIDWVESKFSEGIHIEGCFSGSCSAANLRPCASVFYGQDLEEATTIRKAIDLARNKAADGDGL